MANYWIAKVYNDNIYENCISNNIWMMQQQYNEQETNVVTTLWRRMSRIKVGDWLVLALGNNCYSIGQVIKPRIAANYTDSIQRTCDERKHIYTNGVVYYTDSEAFYEHFDGTGEAAQRFDIAEWFYITHKGGGVPLSGVNSNLSTDGIARETIYGINETFFLKIKAELKERYMNDPMLHSLELLKRNKQLILTGAPGTGKSYTAKKLAAKLTEGSSDDFRVGFVQFHPSYDYTDFMEGLKPVTVAGGMSFQLKNGVFKEFCRKAGVIERIMFGKDWNDYPGVINGELDEYCKSMNEDVKKYWITWVNKNSNLKNKDDIRKALPKFVFIIDEINRAELSKVFGELMYCLEPDYRGSEGKVRTQYSKLNTEDTFFVNKDDDWFFIPSNIYIIGTMNDIDRSVEVFDFALRRRFAWKELKANDVMAAVLRSMLKGWNGDIADLEKRAKDVNEAINSISGLGEHFHIGPSYFGKIALYGDNDEAFKSLWDNHLKPLLFEYLRGTGRETEFLKKCEDKYLNRVNDETVDR